MSVIVDKEFIQKVMRQLPGVPEPRIVVRMFDDPSTSEKEAKQVAEFTREPVAIVSREGKLLAYYIPENKQ
jgi:hypothetical protein